MSEATRSTESPFDDLAILVGMEFNDCSITAAETYQAVRRQFNTEVKTATLYQVDETSSVYTSAQVVNLGVVLSGRETGSPAKLALVWPTAENVIKLKGGFLRRAVTYTQRAPEGDPILAAKIGEDCIIPLASFAHREGSTDCSYVQLGSEMSDDSVVMTGLDTDTPRHQMVEAIRAIVEKPRNNVRDGRKVRVTLQGLLDKQLAKYAEQTVDAREAQLVRRCTEKVAAVEHLQKLNVLTENDNSTYPQDLYAATLLGDARFDDGRAASLALAKDATDETSDIHLLALTRSDIALPIARMDSRTGTIVFENQEWNKPGEYRDDLVSTLLATVRGESLGVEFKTPDDYNVVASEGNDHYYMNGYNLLFAAYCNELGLIKKDEGVPGGGRSDEVITKRITRDGIESIISNLDRFFADPEVETMPYYEKSSVIELAVSRLPAKQKAEAAILNKFDIASELASKLGECSAEEERLVRKLHQMSQQSSTFIADLENLNTGKTDADIAVKAELVKQETHYDLRFFAKPQAQENVEYELFLRYTFDTNQPIFRRDQVSTPEQIDERAKKLFEKLGQLKPDSKELVRRE